MLFLRQVLPRAPDAGYDPNGRGAPSSCFKGTRVEILDSIMAWLGRPVTDVSRPIYWVNGLAGIGKSTIARTVAEQVNGLVPMASFFFARHNDALSNAKLFVTSIAFRLAEIFPKFMETVGNALKADGTLPSKSLNTQFTYLFFQPLQSLALNQPLVLVIDALDECDTKDAQTILNNVVSHCARIPMLSILITSRPENHIPSVFGRANNIEKVFLHDIDSGVVVQDIQHYLECQLKSICEQDEFPSIPPNWPSPIDLKVLVHKSGRLFIWAATAVKFIGDIHILNPDGQLQIILNRSASSQKPYAELDELYHMVLSKGVSNPDCMLDFQHVLATIVLLRNPMSLQTISKFLQIPDIRNLLIHTQSIIPLPQDPEGKVEIYHPSFPDFITDSSRCHDDRFRVDVAGCEGQMSLCCLELLTTGLPDAVYEIVPWHSLNASIANLTTKLTSVVGLEVQYACQFWASHLGKVVLVDEELGLALEKFTGVGVGKGNGYLLKWVMVMSMMGGVHDASRSLQGLLSWLVWIQVSCIRMLIDPYIEVIKVSNGHLHHCE